MTRIAIVVEKTQRQQHRSSRLAGFVAMLVILLLLPSWTCAAEKVLILNSYHRGKTLSDDMIDAIVTGLQTECPGLTFFIEDMDTKRHSVEELSSTLLAVYTKKYRDIDLSAVVTVDNNAFDFVMANRQTLFPGVPVVFCGLNGFQPAMMDGIKGVTGVAEAIDIEATVRVALALHPKTTHIAVISDTTLSGREVLEEFRRRAEQLPKSLKIVELVDLTADELSSSLKNLPQRSVVFRFSFFRDRNGKSFCVNEQVELITEAGLPVYDFWDEAIGAGYVGGYVVTGASQGQPVASMLKRIFAGEAPEQIEVVNRSPNTPVFDKRQLLRTGADLSQLPANAVLRFDEVPFWQRHRGLLSSLGVAFIVILSCAVFFAVLSVQRKRYALALFYEEQKLRATLQSIGEGVVTTNTQGQIEQINSVAEQWMGLTSEKAYGQPADKTFQLTDSGTGSVIELNSSGDFPATASGLLMTADGSSLPIVLTAAPISLPQQSQSGSVIVFRDMTRENQMQQELQQAQRLDALGQLAGGLAHDFNNMLAGIVGAAEILSQRLDSDELSELPKLILDSADRASELTAQLLSFAKEQPIAKQSVHVHQIIGDVVGILTRTVDPRIEIDVRTEADMDLVQGDRALLQSCLLNLGINASHAMPSGGKLSFATREVRLDSPECEENSAGRYIEVLVEDTGTGIPPEVIERIFEPFYTTKEQGKGTGLGLAAVFGTVQQHDGSVTVQSEPGRGTSFTVRLPLTEQPVKQAITLDNGAIEGHGVVLVVDDQDLVRNMAKKTLEVLGYEVLTASNGLEAITLYEREHRRIEVVLLDMVMPKMSGRDCFVELQRLNPDVRVVSTSGFSSPDDLQEMKRLGLTIHLTKPYRCAELSRAVRQALEVDRKFSSLTP